MIKSLRSSSRCWSFAAGALAAMVFTVAVVSIPGINAAVTGRGKVRMFNLDQIKHFYPELAKEMDWNGNGEIDIREGGKVSVETARDSGFDVQAGQVLNIFFSDLDGDGNTEYCQIYKCGRSDINASAASKALSLFSEVTEVPGNGLDDDLDGFPDCEDSSVKDNSPECQGTAPGAEVEGGRNLPDDKTPVTGCNNGFFDCWQPGCAGSDVCLEYTQGPPAPGYDEQPMQDMNSAEQNVPTYPSTPTDSNASEGQSGQDGGERPTAPSYTDQYTSPNPYNPFSPVEYICGKVSGDDNGDGTRNYADPKCFVPVSTGGQGSSPGPVPTTTQIQLHGSGEGICANLQDDDSDRRTDMADLDCRCSQGQQEAGCVSAECSNGLDDDGDRLVDDLDPGCADYQGE